MRELDDLLNAAAGADPQTRIELRDSIAAHGADVIEAMTDWLGDPRLAAFAIRVFERVGGDGANRAAVVDVLASVDRSELPAALHGDLDRALATLGNPSTRFTSRPAGRRSTQRPKGSAGAPGRHYWVMRTSPVERPYIWAEALRGRLRQGWGWNEEMDLDRIAEVVRLGGELSEEQRLSWRSRRMRTSADDGMSLGDYVVTPNLPTWGRLSVFRVAGSYVYELDAPRQFEERFGHILPVELLLESIDRRDPAMTDGLRAMLRPQPRLYSITAYGGDVERLLGRFDAVDRAGATWTEQEYRTLFDRHPPDGERPTDDELAQLAAELRRSVGAVRWQWDDGAAYVSGRAASTTSDALKAWLDRTAT